MVVSNCGVLATTFTVESCNHYYLLAPVFKGPSRLRICPTLSTHPLSVLQTMISQVILGVRYVGFVLSRLAQHPSKRTFNIARRQRAVGIALATAFAITTAVSPFPESANFSTEHLAQLEWFTNMYHRIRECFYCFIVYIDRPIYQRSWPT